MAEQFLRGSLKVVVAQICQVIGWNAIQSTPLDILVDILHRYLKEMGKTTHCYAEQFGRIHPDLDDVCFAFQDMGVNISELEEYVNSVDAVPFEREVPKFPVARESHLNFLKPGSREVLHRPVYVHEHLPPMRPEMEEEDSTTLSIDTNPVNGGEISPLCSPKPGFKRPGDPLSSENPSLKRARLLLEEEGHPLREISSVMMTTSGFISPAREGKLPETRCTASSAAEMRDSSPQPSSSYTSVQSDGRSDNSKMAKKLSIKKIFEGVKKLDKENKQREKEGAGCVLKPEEMTKKKIFKRKDMPKHARFKTFKSSKSDGRHKGSAFKSKLHVPSLPKISKLDRLHKKFEKHKNTKGDQGNVDKLVLIQDTRSKSPVTFEGKVTASEPNKQKLNIFKKISKVKDTIDHSVPQEASPAVLIDTIDAHMLPRQKTTVDDCIDSVIRKAMVEVELQLNRDNSPPRDRFSSFHDFSPPGTPTEPRTPDLPSSTKRQLVDKKHKEDRKQKFNKIKSPLHDYDRPKTPEVAETKVDLSRSAVLPYLANFPAETSILPVPAMNNPLIPQFPYPLQPNLPVPSFTSNKPVFPIRPPVFIPHSRTEESPDDEKVSPSPSPSPTPTRPTTPSLSPVPSIKEDLESIESNSSSTLMEKKKTKDKTKEHRKERKEKLKKKKEKRERREARDIKRKEKEDKKEKEKLNKIKEKGEKKIKKKDRKEKEHENKEEKVKKADKKEKGEGSVPKITVKLGSASNNTPASPDMTPRKIVFKPLPKKEETRSPSPELARFSALITRPPKNKTPPSSSSKKESSIFQSQPQSSSPLPPHPISPIHTSPTPPPQPIVQHLPIAVPKRRGPKKKSEQPAAVVTKKETAGTTAGLITETVGYYMDGHGNKIWICPRCGRQDDGSPMIGCDACDDWYHWVCMNIQVPPAETENWYCPRCIKNKNPPGEGKKRGRKKKIAP